MRQSKGYAAVPLLFLSVASCSNNDWLKNFGEKSYSVRPLLSKENDDIPGLKDNTFAWQRDHEYTDRKLASTLKVRSDAICDRYKLDLTLQQTGTSFLADLLSILIAIPGGIVGGLTGQVSSAVQGGATGFKNTASGDIYQKVTGVISNYIDSGRNEQWAAIQKNLDTGSYRNDQSLLFADIQTYHDSCSLQDALKTAAAQSGKEAAKAANDAKNATPGGAAAVPPPAPAPATAATPARHR